MESGIKLPYESNWNTLYNQRMATARQGLGSFGSKVVSPVHSVASAIEALGGFGGNVASAMFQKDKRTPSEKVQSNISPYLENIKTGIGSKPTSVRGGVPTPSGVAPIVSFGFGSQEATQPSQASVPPKTTPLTLPVLNKKEDNQFYGPPAMFSPQSTEAPKPFSTPAFAPIQARQTALPEYQNKDISLNQALQGYGPSNSFFGALMNLGLAKGDMSQAHQQGKALNDFNISRSLADRQNADRQMEADRANLQGRKDYSALAMEGALQPFRQQHLKQQIGSAENQHLLDKEKIAVLSGLSGEEKRGFLFPTSQTEGADSKTFHSALGEALKGLMAGTIQQENIPPELKAFMASKGLLPAPPKPAPKKGWFD